MLIPRPETEELVTWIVDDTRQEKLFGKNNEAEMLDIGTGSGCIAISLKKELAGSVVTAIDVSADALSSCKKKCR